MAIARLSKGESKRASALAIARGTISPCCFCVNKVLRDAIARSLEKTQLVAFADKLHQGDQLPLDKVTMN